MPHRTVCSPTGCRTQLELARKGVVSPEMTRVAEREVEGCDFIHLNGDGLIEELYVMIRPLSGLTAVTEAMGRLLASGESAEQGEPQAAA